mgnify:CR=1 FL=1
MPPTIIPPPMEQTTIVWMEPVSYAIKLTLFAVPSNLQILSLSPAAYPYGTGKLSAGTLPYPYGGVMARLAAHTTHTGPVIYTAHGFHFFKGAKPVNWLCYYPMERFLSRYTDQQICINYEDYERAKKAFHARYTDYIPGVGIDPSRIPHLTEEDIKKKEGRTWPSLRQAYTSFLR